MILTRQGNKRRIAPLIIPHFPAHDIYIEPFFGAGGLFFSKPKVQYNLMNDLDDEVCNLFLQIKNSPDDLKYAISIMPVHETLFSYWRKLKKEHDPVYKAVRFLFLSNFSYLAAGDTFSVKPNSNTKALILQRFDVIHSMISDVIFTNSDFRFLFNKISLDAKVKARAFVYADPPYIKTKARYAGFSVRDTQDLIEILLDKNVRFAVSEFESKELDDLIRLYRLRKIEIAERRNLNNRRTEILIVNYK